MIKMIYDLLYSVGNPYLVCVVCKMSATFVQHVINILYSIVALVPLVQK